MDIIRICIMSFWIMYPIKNDSEVIVIRQEETKTIQEKQGMEKLTGNYPTGKLPGIERFKNINSMPNVKNMPNVKSLQRYRP